MANACLISHVRAGELAHARSVAEYLSEPDALAAKCRDLLTGVATVRIVTNPPGGEVFLGDESRGRAPVELRVPAPWWEARIAVAFGETRHEVTAEELTDALDANSCELTDVVVAGPPVPPEQFAVDATEGTDDSTAYPEWLGLGLTIGGGVVLVTGAIFVGVGWSAANEVDTTSSFPEVADDAARARWMIPVGYALLGVGAAAAATGVFFLSSSDGGEEPDATQLGVGLGGVELRGRF